MTKTKTPPNRKNMKRSKRMQINQKTTYLVRGYILDIQGPMKSQITQLKNGKRLEHTNSLDNTYANMYMKRRTTH